MPSAFITTVTENAILSTEGLSVVPGRGILQYKIAGVMITQDSFTNLADAQTQYDYVKSALQPFNSITITAVTPDGGSPVNAGTGDTVQIYGSGFISTAYFVASDFSVTEAHIFLSPVFISSTQFSVTVPGGADAWTAGTYDVTYIDPNGGVALSVGSLILV